MKAFYVTIRTASGKVKKTYSLMSESRDSALDFAERLDVSAVDISVTDCPERGLCYRPVSR